MIRLVSLACVVAGLALLFLVVVPALQRRHARLERKREREKRIEDYQDQAALEDLDRTRRRINESQDRMHEEGAARIGYALFTIASLALVIFAGTYLIQNMT